MDRTVRPTRSLKLIVPTLLAAGLAACGGGGGDDTSAGTSSTSGIPTSAAGVTGDMSAGNYATVALQVRDVVSLGTDAAAFLGPTGSDGGTSVSQSRVLTTSTHLFSTATRASFGRKSVQSAGGTASPQGVTTVTEGCSGGGTITVTIDDLDNNDQASAGDSMTIVANQCMEDGERLNGQASVSVGAFSDTRVVLSMQFQGFSVSDLALSGTATLELSYSGADYSATLAMSNVVLTEAGQPTVKATFSQSVAFTQSTGLASTSTQGGIVFGADSYWIQQVTPYQASAPGAYPFTGRLSVTDKDGDKVVAVATPSSMRYEFYTASNRSSTPDAVTEVTNP